MTKAKDLTEAGHFLCWKDSSLPDVYVQFRPRSCRHPDHPGEAPSLPVHTLILLSDALNTDNSKNYSGPLADSTYLARQSTD